MALVAFGGTGGLFLVTAHAVDVERILLEAHLRAFRSLRRLGRGVTLTARLGCTGVGSQTFISVMTSGALGDLEVSGVWKSHCRFLGYTVVDSCALGRFGSDRRYRDQQAGKKHQNNPVSKFFIFYIRP